MPETREERLARIQAALGAAPDPVQTRTGAAAAVGVNTQAEAEFNQLSRRYGVPLSVVRDDPVSFRRRAAAEDNEARAATTPTTATFIADPRRSTVGPDDADEMGFLERVTRGGGESGSRALGGLASLGEAVSPYVTDWLMTLGSDLGIPTVRTNEDAQGRTVAPYNRRMTLDERAMSPAERVRRWSEDGRQILQNAPGALPAAGRAALNLDDQLRGADFGYEPGTTWQEVKDQPVRNFIPFAMEQGLISVPDMYMAVANLPVYVAARTGDIGETRAENDLRDEATLEDFVNALPAAAGSALLERLATRRIIGFDDAVRGGARGIPGAVARGAAIEAGTEALQEGIESAGETLGTGRGFDTAETLDRMAAGAVGGGGFGGVVRATTATGEVVIQRFQQRTVQAQQAEAQVETVDNLMQAAEASQLRERDPQTFSDFIAEAAADGPITDVYVDAQTLAQSLKTPEDAALLTEDQQMQLATAMYSGGDVRIPVQDFATRFAGSPVYAALKDHLRTSPDGMTRTEARQFVSTQSEALRIEFERVMAANAQRDAAEASTREVKAEMMAQLERTGRFTPEVNEAYATYTAEYMATMAARHGQTAMEMFQRSMAGNRPLNVAAEGQIGDGVLDQLTPEFEAWFGDSKVRDETGKPLVVYHGTEEGGFTTFDKDRQGFGSGGGGRQIEGFYFTNHRAGAQTYSGPNREVEISEDERKPGIYSVFLNMRNPYEIDMEGRDWTGDHPDLGFDDYYNMDDIAARAKAEGYDGVIARNVMDEGRHGQGYGWGDTTYVVFEPEQIKSVFNRGTFDPTDPDILNQSPVFYSAVEKTLQDSQTARATADQWKATLQRTPGVKKEELEWTGILDWLDTFDRPVERTEVLAFIQSNGVKVEEVTLGGEADYDAMYQDPLFQETESQLADEAFDSQYTAVEYDVQYDEDADEYFVEADGERYTAPDEIAAERLAQELSDEHRQLARENYDTPDWVFDQAREVYLDGRSAAKHERYTHRGGEDYTELLFTLPTIRGPATHWDTPNVVAHTRFKSREDADGNRVLFLEEVQSDWHQKGRDEGYAQPFDQARFDTATQALEAAAAAVRSNVDQLIEDLLPIVRAREEVLKQIAAEKQQAHAQIILLQLEENGPTSEDERAADKESIRADGVLYDFSNKRRALEDPQSLTSERVNAVHLLLTPTGATPEVFWGEQITTLRDQFGARDDELYALDLRLNEASQAQRIARGNTGIPNAPFKTSWSALVMKRIIRYAADNGFQKVAWITGEQQNGGRTVGTAGTVRIKDMGDDLYEVMPDAYRSEMIDKLVNLRRGKVAKKDDTRSNAEILGEKGELMTAAEVRAIFNTYSRKIGDQMLAEGAARNGYVAYVDASVVGLHDDGHGFYDRMLVNITNDLVKKYGAKVERIFVDEVSLSPADAPAPGEAVTSGGNPGFSITMELRAAANAGFTLFQNNRGSFSPSTNTITLGKKADLSTFLHEMGHFQLETMMFLAAQSGAPQQIVQDAETVLAWFGLNGLPQWQAMSLDEQREHHEKWARGVEAYLLEGKSPSLKLRPIFQRFRAWLLAVYRDITRLNVELSDEVRAVMDRMLATDEQIAEAEQARSLAPLFDSRPATMTEDEWIHYQQLAADATQSAQAELSARSVRDMRWLDNARSGLLKRMQKDASARRKAVKAEVTAEVMDEPINRARQFLRRGEGATEGSPHKLDIAAVKAMYPEGRPGSPEGERASAVLKLLGYGKYGMLAEGGLSPDEAAEMFGYSSGQALVDDLIGGEDPKVKIEGLTDARMLERYGDLSDDDAMARAVDEALHNDARLRFVATELNMMAKATGNQRILASAARDYAQQMVGRMKLRDLKPHLYTAAEARAARAADKALRSGKEIEAVTEKRNQLLNGQVAKAVMTARQETERGSDLFKRIISAKDATLAKSRDMDLVNAARAILAAHGVGRVKNNPAAYMDAVKRYDPGLYADIEPFLLDAVAGAQPLDEMTFEQFVGLRTVVDQLWTLARRAKASEIDGELVSRDLILGELGERIDVLVDKRGGAKPVTEAATDGQKLLRGLAGIRASATRVEHWIKVMDGGDAGPWRKYVWQPLSEAADRYRAAKVPYLVRYRDLLNGLGDSLTAHKIEAPEIGYTFQNKAELLHAVMHTGNDSNRRKLLLGRGWGRETAEGALNDTQWRDLVARLEDQGVLTAADYDFVQAVWDMLEDTKPAAQAAHHAVFGRYFDEITAAPLETAYGVLRGGYVPAIADAFLVDESAQRQDAEALQSADANMFPAPARGFTKSRVENYTRELALDLRLIPQHIDQVLKFSYLAAPTRDVLRLLKQRGFSRKLTSFDPVAVTDLLLPWLNRSASQRVMSPMTGWGGKAASVVFREVRARTGIQAMFSNLTNTMQQVTSFSMAALRVRPKYLGRGLWAFVSDPAGLASAVSESSSFMATRISRQAFDMHAEIERLVINPSPTQKARAFFERHAYFMQQAMQNVMDLTVWAGANAQALDQGLSEREASRFANAAVRATQSSLNPEDISRVETGNAFVRMFTQFAGFFNNWANLLGSEYTATVNAMGLRKGAGRLVFIYLAGFAIPAFMNEVIVHAMRGDIDDEDDDGYLDTFLSWFFGGQFRSATAMLPGVGPLVNSAINRFNDLPYDDRISTAPAVSTLERSVGAPQKVYAAIVGEGDKSAAVKDTLTLVGMMTGMPVGALGRPLGYATDVAEGDAVPANAADYVRGLATGAASR